jgi:quinoprotein glucose dehydrogenase
VVVLDALTGRRVWSYQTIHHDLWDYDLPAMPTLATIEYQGRPVDAVIQGTKTGNIFVLDRQSGKPLFPVREMPVPQKRRARRTGVTSPADAGASAPRHLAGAHRGSGLRRARVRQVALQGEAGGVPQRRHVHPAKHQGLAAAPSFLGGTNWGGIAYDPNTGLAVVNSSNLVSSVILKPRAEYDEKRDKRPGVSVYEMRGSPYVMLREVLLSPLGAPCNPPPWGQLTAIDAKTGQTRWQIPFGRIRFSSGLSSPASWGAPTRAGRS